MHIPTKLNKSFNQKFLVCVCTADRQTDTDRQGQYAA